MGKRKSKTKVIKVKSTGLRDSFDCFSCHGEDTIIVKISKDLIGTLRCRGCNFSAEYSCNPLDRAVDVYAMWSDQIHEMNTLDGDEVMDVELIAPITQAPVKKEEKVKKVSVYGHDQTEVAGDVSEDEYDGDDLDIVDEELVQTSDEEGESKSSKKSKKDKKDRKVKRESNSFGDDSQEEEEFDSDFGSDSDDGDKKKKSKKDKKDRKSSKKDKKEKKSKKFRSNKSDNVDPSSSNSADQEFVQLPPPSAPEPIPVPNVKVEEKRIIIDSEDEEEAPPIKQQIE